MKKIFLLILVILLSFTVVSCDLFNKTTTTTEVVSTNTTLQNTTLSTDDFDLVLDDETRVIAVDGEYLIEYTLNFELLATDTITFVSSNSAVASVSALGVVKGLSVGEATITVRYSEELYKTMLVTVTDQVEISPPNKTIYQLGENLNLFGAKIISYDGQIVLEEIPITAEMISNYDSDQTGSQFVEFDYNGNTYSFEVYVLDEIQEKSLFIDCINLNTENIVGEKIEFALTKSNLEEFLAVVNVYDYEQINVYGLFTTPDGVVMKMPAFWYVDYKETAKAVSIISSFNTEGKVNDTDRDYDVQVSFEQIGDAHYRLRYLPESIGDYEATIVVEVDGQIIQSFNKSFTVNESTTDDFKGFVKVDETNNRHFVFDSGATYIPVGQNVAWYTSTQRMHYDFLSWFEQMESVGMNYARLWMAPWGYSIFWDDLYDYDDRQTRMYSMDRTMDYADEFDIYIQLCLLNHGMFSAETNPMWPNTENNWYISRYGVNPYSTVISDSGDFFSDDEMKSLYKNQLIYTIARYGYSDMIMSFELFNEVDWIETYNATDGVAWHSEMAAFIKNTDPYKHLITTSHINESFFSSNFTVYNDDNIDFISIHRYGIYDHTDYLAVKQNYCFNIFNKPVLYDEVGYQGWGGQQQVEADPNNVTLHQALWGGALGGGAGTGMNWWWESWIDKYDFYSEYQGVAVFTEDMDLSGSDYQFVYSEDIFSDLLDVSNNNVSYMGYLVEDRLYLYVYDEDYELNNQSVSLKQAVTIEIPDCAAGIYSYEVYDTFTGAILYTETVIVGMTGDYTITLPNFNIDLAIKFVKTA
ncbi:MAG: Ig-like domain-containing protein [Tenericutes bacterium]|nr:Ig-like domain-containing protein [Mycoplasmatota bacterium]